MQDLEIITTLLTWGKLIFDSTFGCLKGLLLSPWSPTSIVAIGIFPVLVYILVKLGLAFDYLGVVDHASSNGKNIRKYIHWAFPRKIFCSKSIRQDLKISVVNSFLSGPFAVLSIPYLDASVTMYLVRNYLQNKLDITSAATSPTANGFAIELIYIIAVLVAFDFGSWTSHYLMHKVPFLWEFHKVHHSAEGLAGITNTRSHFVDEILYAGFGGSCMAIVSTFVPLVFGFTPSEQANTAPYVLLWVIMSPLGILFHSHIWLSLGKLEYFLQSPAMHAIHHSNDPKHYNKNFGSMFSIFDTLFGTLYRTEKSPSQVLKLGVTDSFNWNEASVLDLYIQPFRKCYRLATNVLRNPFRVFYITRD